MSWKPPQPPTPSELALIASRLPLSESTRRLNDSIKPGSAMTRSVVVEKSRIQNSATLKPRMNKLELRFYELLKNRYSIAIDTLGEVTITPQFRLRVSDWNAPVPVHYTADFLLSKEGACDHWHHMVYEVKDSRRKPHSDELTRPKMVKEHNPWISAVILATWDGSAWTEKQIA